MRTVPSAAEEPEGNDGHGVADGTHAATPMRRPVSSPVTPEILFDIALVPAAPGITLEISPGRIVCRAQGLAIADVRAALRAAAAAAERL